LATWRATIVGQTFFNAMSDPWRDCTRVPGTFMSCVKRQEPVVLQNRTEVAHRRGLDLILRLVNRDSVVLHDSITEGPGAIEYWLQDIHDNPGYFLVGFHGYEDRGSMLISTRSGWRKEFPFNFPVFSPDGRFVALTIPVGTAYWDPAIDIYAVSSDTLVQELSVDARTDRAFFVHGDTLWGPDNPQWVGQVLHFATGVLRNQRDTFLGRPMILAIIGGGWKLREEK